MVAFPPRHYVGRPMLWAEIVEHLPLAPVMIATKASARRPPLRDPYPRKKSLPAEAGRLKD